jgi:hypothetical protein
VGIHKPVVFLSLSLSLIWKPYKRFYRRRIVSRAEII